MPEDYVVHDNDSPCDGCGKVTIIATINMDGGWPLVSCSDCKKTTQDSESLCCFTQRCERADCEICGYPYELPPRP